MTAAERQQRKRDRRKAGLVRIEVWVPADKAEEIMAAIARICAKDQQRQKPEGGQGYASPNQQRTKP